MVVVVVIPAVQSVSALGSDGHTSKALCLCCIEPLHTLPGKAKHHTYLLRFLNGTCQEGSAAVFEKGICSSEL